MADRKRPFSAAFLAPALLLYSAFVFIPVVVTVYYSFTNWRIGRDVRYVGFQNYVNLFTDPQYWAVAYNSFALVAAAVLIQVPVALVLAYMLHWVGHGYRLYRSIIFLPVVIAPIAFGLAFAVFLNGDIGALNSILTAIGLESWTRSWLSDQHTVLWAVNIPTLWHGLGLYTIIFVAAIRSLPAELFEAAIIDGASKVVMLPLIVVPLIREAIVICVILATTNAIRAFDMSWVMTQGGPGQASSYFATMIYKRGFTDGAFGYAAATAVTLLIYVLLLAWGVRRLLLGRQGS
jgi:raffinose/stachyose/melibiose transport system permease protein